MYVRIKYIKTPYTDKLLSYNIKYNIYRSKLIFAKKTYR